MESSPKLSRSQCLLQSSKQATAKTFSVRIAGQQSAARSLPPPFPPIRLRRAEQEDLLRRVGVAPHTAGYNNNNSNNSESPSDGGGSLDFAMRQHPLSALWIQSSDTMAVEERQGLAMGPACVHYTNAVAAVADTLEAGAIRALGGSNALFTLATEKGIVVPYSWYSTAADSLFSKIDVIGEMRQAKAAEGHCAEWDSVVDEDAAQRCRIAVATSLLWRMLTQVRSVVAGMDTALSLFEEFILPSVFENIDSLTANSPPVSSLSALIRSLGCEEARITIAELNASKKAGAALERENGYLRKTIENWGFQIWRGATRASKRRDVALGRWGALAKRVPDDRLKRLVFSSWRLHTHRQRVENVSRRYRDGFQDFLDSSPNEGLDRADVKMIASAVVSSQHSSRENNNSINNDGASGAITSPFTPSRPRSKPNELVSHRMASISAHGGFHTHSDDPSSAIESTCDAMLKKIRQLDSIGVALRGQTAHQVNTINRLDRQLKEANTKIESLTAQLLDLNGQKLALINLLHDKELEFVEMERTHRRLISKNKLQLHAPWKQSSIRLLSEACGVLLPPCPSERTSEKYLSRDLLEDDTDLLSYDAAMLPTREEVAFGRIAPLVVTNSGQMPDPLLILIDWTNACLDQLHDLDGLGDAGPFAARLSDVSDLSVGTILPRLLYFLALPLYRPSGVMQHPTDDCVANRLRLLTGYDCASVPPGPSFTSAFGDLVRQPAAARLASLIEFASDLISGHSRSEAHFSAADDSDAHRTASLFDSGGIGPAALAAQMFLQSKGGARHVGGNQPVAASLPNLREVVSPLMLASGCRNSSVTLLAVLYLRFAHAFNHKAVVERVEEESILRGLAEEALASRHEMEKVLLDHQRSCAASGAPADALPSSEPHQENPYRDVLRAFATDDKTPWQLYFERCRPLVCSGANGFLSKGNFWDLSSIESSETFDIFGRMLMAMRASLENHRWHILSTCLLSGPSCALSEAKALSHGPLGSSISFLMAQCAARSSIPGACGRLNSLSVAGTPSHTSGREGGAESAAYTRDYLRRARPLFDSRFLHTILLHRGDVDLASFTLSADSPTTAFLSQPDYQCLEEEEKRIVDFIGRYAHEWCDLFLSRSTSMVVVPIGSLRCPQSSATSAVWTLPAWRMFWRELGATLDVLDEELLTDLFQIACSSHRVDVCFASDPHEDTPAGGVSVELLPTFNWNSYSSVALRSRSVTNGSASSDYAFLTDSGYALPLVSGDYEVAVRATQELNFYEWLEAMARTISVVLPRLRSAESSGGAFGSEVYSLAEQSTMPPTLGSPVSFLKSIEWFTFSKIVGPFSSPGLSSDLPRHRLQQFVRGAYIEEVFRYHRGALHLIFEHYGTFRGAAPRQQGDTVLASLEGVTIEFADWFAMIKESGAISSSELTQGGLMEVFLAASVEMRSHSNSPPSSKSLQRLAPYPPGDARRLTPAGAAAASAAISKTRLLPFAHFGLSLAILAQVKFPNPLRALHVRLHTFLLKCIESPLCSKIPALGLQITQRSVAHPSWLER